MSTSDKHLSHGNRSGRMHWSFFGLCAQKPNSQEKNDGPRFARLILAVMVVITVLVAGTVGVVVWKSNDKSTPASVGMETNVAPSSVVEEFLSGLPAYSLDLAENDDGSPQAKALAWLKEDPLYHEYRSVHRLNQRYALAVLFFSTNGTSWTNSTGWLSDDNECTWFMISFDDICSATFRLLTLQLGGVELDGSLPRELELLSDLESLDFWDQNLSGAIYLEM
jgi:hypothetical protein